jgi:hypothetical protein
MNNSQESNSEISGNALGAWLQQIAVYGPIEIGTPPSDGAVAKLSVSVLPEIKTLVTARAKMLGLSRSQYIRFLVDADIKNKS